MVTLGDRLAEYGCTLDACCKFARELEIRPSGDTPLLLVQVDQAGVLHAPHAQARAYFHECGRDDVVVPIHDAAGIVSLRTIAQLCPGETSPS